MGMTDISNAVDAFINAIVDGLIKHEKFNEHIAGIVSNDGFTDDYLYEQIELWMSNTFSLNDYGHFDISDYSYEIFGMIDDHVDRDFISDALTDVEWEVKVKGSR
jgi:hypothetical protein